MQIWAIAFSGVLVSVIGLLVTLWVIVRNKVSADTQFQTATKSEIEHLKAWKEEHEAGSTRKLEEIKEELAGLRSDAKEDRESHAEDRRGFHLLLNGLTEKLAKLDGKLEGAGVFDRDK